jgi:hypothetical protein
LLAGKWMDMMIIMLNKISQTEKDVLHVFSHIWKADTPPTPKNRITQYKMGVGDCLGWKPVGMKSV